MIERYLNKINAGIRDVLDRANRHYRLRQVSDHLFAFSREFVLRKGKRIRPLLFVLSYRGYAAKPARDERSLFISAASIELLHDYMLIHDDVIDNSDLRRGKPTLHKMFDSKLRFADGARIGAHLAIVAGDILFALAIESFMAVKEDPRRKEETLKKLAETAAYTGAGEFIDIVSGHERIDQLTEDRIFLNYTLKTARYTFECPLLMGAILAGAAKREKNKLSRLGLAAGQAFQLYDDMLDLFATQDVIGKPILSDLNESKKTLLVFRAHKKLGGGGRKTLRMILEKKHKTLADLKSLRRLIVESGSYTSCFNIMNALQKEAMCLTLELDMKPSHKTALRSIIEKLSPARMPLDLPSR
ncbi:MAG: polyprenyl synthetase family protein [Candidatus Omnitrophica bacterium]|nr:polyprenyl synthetase family protein [Candidatus Omnitrophota bacterium]